MPTLDTVTAYRAPHDTRHDRYQDYYLRTGDQAQRVDLTSFFDAAPLATAVAELGRL